MENGKKNKKNHKQQKRYRLSRAFIWVLTPSSFDKLVFGSLLFWSNLPLRVNEWLNFRANIYLFGLSFCYLYSWSSSGTIKVSQIVVAGVDILAILFLASYWSVGRNITLVRDVRSELSDILWTSYEKLPRLQMTVSSNIRYLWLGFLMHRPNDFSSVMQPVVPNYLRGDSFKEFHEFISPGRRTHSGY